MTQPFDTVQTFGKDRFNETLKAFGPMCGTAQAIVVESADHAKKSFEQSTAAFKKLTGAKSLQTAIQIQTDHIKSVTERFVAHSSKMRELSTTLAKEAFAPFSAVRSTSAARAK